MLATDAGKQTLHRFFEQYLGYSERRVDPEAQHRDVRVGGADMVQETRAFINQIVFQNAGGLKTC
jgi:hypothetical protein